MVFCRVRAESSSFLKFLSWDPCCLFCLLTSSPTTRLYRGPASRLTCDNFTTMTSVSAGHIILTPTQPVGSGRPQWKSNPGPPHEESSALPTERLRPLGWEHPNWAPLPANKPQLSAVMPPQLSAVMPPQLSAATTERRVEMYSIIKCTLNTTQMSIFYGTFKSCPKFFEQLYTARVQRWNLQSVCLCATTRQKETNLHTNASVSPKFLQRKKLYIEYCHCSYWPRSDNDQCCTLHFDTPRRSVGTG